MITSVVLVALATNAGPGGAQDKPRYGGELIFIIPIEAPSLDRCARLVEPGRRWPTPATIRRMAHDTRMVST